MTYYNLVKLAEEQKQERDPHALKKGIAGIGAGIGLIQADARRGDEHRRQHPCLVDARAVGGAVGRQVDHVNPGGRPVVSRPAAGRQRQ